MNSNVSKALQFLVFVLALFLLSEWLYPVPAISNTAGIGVFIGFAFISALLIYTRLSPFFIIPVLIVSSLYGVHFLHVETMIFSQEGLRHFLEFTWEEMKVNQKMIFSRDFASLTDPFRTFLIFMLLALVGYLLYFWVFQVRRIFLFIIGTVIYVTVIDTFTAYDATIAIVRTVGIGFFMFTLLHMIRVIETSDTRRKGQWKVITAWLTALAATLLVAIGIGTAAPKPEPQWADPVPGFKRTFLGEEVGLGARRVGYGENDERLGGGFIQDEARVFRAITSESVYWRGESKDEYTGHGWVSEREYETSDTLFSMQLEHELFGGNIQYDEKIAEVRMEDNVNFTHLFYPGQLRMADINQFVYERNGQRRPLSALDIRVDATSGRIEAGDAVDGFTDEFSIKAYTITYDAPTFSIPVLENVSEDDPDDIAARYLQLPDDLPERVGALAEEIAEPFDNRYDTVKAIEQYFSNEGFEYRTSDIPIPDEGQDYVDQFLFDTQVGYCDNYSTSMAVMLRTLDIPTRWVKGFTAGEFIDNVGPNGQMYDISSGNAHSWVEVYFPEVGWVPFEPTQGFTNYAEFTNLDTRSEQEIENAASAPEAEEQEEEDENEENVEMPEIPLEEEEEEEESVSVSGGSGDDFRWTALSTILISFVVTIAVMLAYVKQTKIQHTFFAMKYKAMGSDHTYESAYERLLWILESEGLSRGEDETLREYARRIDEVIGSKAMNKLTKAYERSYYGEQAISGEWELLQPQWQEVMKRLHQMR